MYCVILLIVYQVVDYFAFVARKEDAQNLFKT